MSFSYSAVGKEESIRLLTLIRRCGHSAEELKIAFKELVIFLQLNCYCIQESIQGVGIRDSDDTLRSLGANGRKAAFPPSDGEDFNVLLHRASVLVGAFCRHAARSVSSSQEGTTTSSSLYYGEECGSCLSPTAMTSSHGIGNEDISSIHALQNARSSSILPTPFPIESFWCRRKVEKGPESRKTQKMPCEYDQKEVGREKDQNQPSDSLHADRGGCSCCGGSFSTSESRHWSKRGRVGEAIHWLVTSSTFSFLLHRPVYSQKHDILVLASLLEFFGCLVMTFSLLKCADNSQIDRRPLPHRRAPAADASEPQLKSKLLIEKGGTNTPFAQEENTTSVVELKYEETNHRLGSTHSLPSLKDSLPAYQTPPFFIPSRQWVKSSFHSLLYSSSSSISSAVAYGLREVLKYDQLLCRRTKESLFALLTGVSDASAWDVLEIVMTLMDITFLFNETDDVEDDGIVGIECETSSSHSSLSLSTSLFEALLLASPHRLVAALSLPTGSYPFCAEGLSTPPQAVEGAPAVSVVCRTPLHCPFTSTLVQYPARGLQCRHFEFFDACHFVVAVMQSLSSSYSATRNSRSSAVIDFLSSGATHHSGAMPGSSDVENIGRESNPSCMTATAGPSSPSLRSAGGPCPFCRKFVRIEELRIDVRVLRAMSDALSYNTRTAEETPGEVTNDNRGNSNAVVGSPLSPRTHVVEWVIDSSCYIPTVVESDEDREEDTCRKEETMSQNEKTRKSKEVLPSLGVPSVHWSTISAIHLPFSCSSGQQHQDKYVNDRSYGDCEAPYFRKCHCRVVKQSSLNSSLEGQRVEVDEPLGEGKGGIPPFYSSLLPCSNPHQLLVGQNEHMIGKELKITRGHSIDSSCVLESHPPTTRRRVDIAGHVLYVEE